MTAPTLDGVPLPDQLRWVDRYSWRPVEQNYRRTRGGQQHIYAMAISGGRPITLVADPEECWWDADQLAWLWGLAQEAGAVYALIIGGQTHRVMIDSIDLQPVYPLAEDASGLTDGDQFSGTVKFIEVP